MAAPQAFLEHALVDMHQGDTRRLRFTIENLDDVSVVQSAQWDLYLRKSVNSLLLKATGSGITLDLAENQIIVSMASGDSATLDPGMYFDELRLVYNTGDEELVAKGPIQIRDRRVGE